MQLTQIGFQRTGKTRGNTLLISLLNYCLPILQFSGPTILENKEKQDEEKHKRMRTGRNDSKNIIGT